MFLTFLGYADALFHVHLLCIIYCKGMKWICECSKIDRRKGPPAGLSIVLIRHFSFFVHHRDAMYRKLIMGADAGTRERAQIRWRLTSCARCTFALQKPGPTTNGTAVCRLVPPRVVALTTCLPSFLSLSAAPAPSSIHQLPPSIAATVEVRNMARAVNLLTHSLPHIVVHLAAYCSSQSSDMLSLATHRRGAFSAGRSSSSSSASASTESSVPLCFRGRRHFSLPAPLDLKVVLAPSSSSSSSQQQQQQPQQLAPLVAPQRYQRYYARHYSRNLELKQQQQLLSAPPPRNSQTAAYEAKVRLETFVHQKQQLQPTQQQQPPTKAVANASHIVQSLQELRRHLQETHRYSGLATQQHSEVKPTAPLPPVMKTVDIRSNAVVQQPRRQPPPPPPPSVSPPLKFKSSSSSSSSSTASSSSSRHGSPGQMTIVTYDSEEEDEESDATTVTATRPSCVPVLPTGKMLAKSSSPVVPPLMGAGSLTARPSLMHRERRLAATAVLDTSRVERQQEWARLPATHRGPVPLPAQGWFYDAQRAHPYTAAATGAFAAMSSVNSSSSNSNNAGGAPSCAELKVLTNRAADARRGISDALQRVKELQQRALQQQQYRHQPSSTATTSGSLSLSYADRAFDAEASRLLSRFVHA